MMSRFIVVGMALFALSCGMQTTGTTEEEKAKVQDPKVLSPQADIPADDAGSLTSEDASGIDGSGSWDAANGLQDASSGSMDASLAADASNTGPNCPIPCNDGNPCTDDVCDSVRGCIYSPNTASCDDGNPCTVNDRCSLGTCQGGENNTCNDSNSCTTDSCVEGVGCQHSPTNEGNSCGQYGKVCRTGICTCPTGAVENCLDGIDNNCDGKVDCADPICQYKSCNDNSKCTENDTCVDGTCQGSPIVCDKAAFLAFVCTQHHWCIVDREFAAIQSCVQLPGTCNPTVGCQFAPTLANNCHATDPTNPYYYCTATSECNGAEYSTDINGLVRIPFRCYEVSFLPRGTQLSNKAKCDGGDFAGIKGKSCFDGACFDGSSCNTIRCW